MLRRFLVVCVWFAFYSPALAQGKPSSLAADLVLLNAKIWTVNKKQPEAEALKHFLELMSGFDPESDVLVGHNIIGFDLPFIFQRCLVNNIAVKPFVDLSNFHVEGVYDTMHAWWLGGRNRVALDDLAWALGIESSKTSEVEGSRVFELYQAGRLAEIREYNLNDVRVTRKIYERLVKGFGA